MSIPHLVKQANITHPLSTSSIHQENVQIFHVNINSIEDILKAINALRTTNTPDEILIHRDSGGHITTVEWRTFQKLP